MRADAPVGKEGNPQLSVQLVIRAVRQRPEVPPDLPLPPSTVHRLRARHGLMDSAKTAGESADRRRFAFAQACELWMSFCLHGLSVVVGERLKRKTYLIAFIDDATRVIPHATFALAESTRAFLLVLEQAILRRGLPQKLFVDNGANDRSKHLALVCAKLGIALIHARPYQPQGKGKIERWFKTVRAQLLTRLTEPSPARPWSRPVRSAPSMSKPPARRSRHDAQPRALHAPSTDHLDAQAGVVPPRPPRGPH